jgi:hypothetical protein
MMIMGAGAQETPVLYRTGVALKDQGISVRSWGSGICSETEEAAYEGTTSVRIATKNLYQGGAFTFSKPGDVSAAFADKYNLLRITFKTLDAATGTGGGGAPGPGAAGAAGGGGGSKAGDGEESPEGGFDSPFVDPQGGPGGGFGRPGGAGPGGGQKGGSGFGAPGAGGAGGASSGVVLKSIRLIITTTDGLRSEAVVPTSAAGTVERGWKQAGVPLQAIKGFARTNKVIKDIAFSGDVSTAFYIGDIRILSDKTPIRGEPNFRTYTGTTNDTITFSATGFGGSSVLKYTWDFDDSDGIQIDAEGQTVKYRYRVPSNGPDVSTRKPNGQYTATLTITDLYGLKESYSTTMKIKIN